MKRISASLVMMAVFCVGALALMGAGSTQRPPQPFFQDFISGFVTVQGEPGVPGTRLIACIEDCDTVFQSKDKTLAEGGWFELLEVNPSDENLIGREISFYLVNEFGKIKAVETRKFVGVFDFYPTDLTFNDPVPTPPATAVPPVPTMSPIPTGTPVPPTATITPDPTPTAILPATGDKAVTAIPRLALWLGGSAVIVGAGFLFVFRRGNER